MDSSPGGVILYVGSSGSPSPGSPSSGYQTQSPSSHSQPSSPEEVTFTEIGALKHGGNNASPPPPKLVFQFPEVTGTTGHALASTTHVQPIAGKRPLGFTGTFTKNGGMVLLCKVCGDIASGFHYGVHACEGCKGFFRRSIQQNIHYKMCVKNENCLIMRMNRNRCQHCRFKKCLSVGMSRDAVRFGRIPKREKQRLLDEMQSYMNSLSDPGLMDTESTLTQEAPPIATDNQSEVAIGAISRAYRDIFLRTQQERQVKPEGLLPIYHKSTAGGSSCPNHLLPSSSSARLAAPITQENISSLQFANNSPYSYSSFANQTHCTAGLAPPPHAYASSFSSYVTESPGQASCPWRVAPGAKVLACPLNTSPASAPGLSSQQVWESFSQCFTPAVREVVEFAKGIPGFQSLSQHDQVMLLKAGTFQVLMVRFCTLFNAQERTVTFLNGQTYPLPALRALGMGALLDAMFEFSEKLGALGLESDEMALFMAVVLVSADRSGISNVAAVEQLQESLIRALRSLVTRRRPQDSGLFPKLLLRLPDLRTLNNLHSDKLLAFRIDP